jgi:hypothetical protein
MKLHMRARLIVLCAILAVLAFYSSAMAEVNLTVRKTLKLDNAPLDAVISADGLRTYVLTEGGKIRVYSAKGDLTDTINVDKNVDGIEVTQTGDNLILLSKKNKTVQVAAIDFVRQINTKGSPFRGDPDGPVVIAVFSDFQ